MPRLRLVSVVLAAAAVAAAFPAASGAATTLQPLDHPTRVAAYRGVAMWSVFDAAIGGYRLVKSVDGGAPVVLAGVRPRFDAPFDVDLGTNRSGSLYAVYTRKGDLYRMSVASGVETRLSSLTSGIGDDERMPSIQRGEIAFIRHEHGRDYLRIGNTTSGSRGSRVLRRAASIRSVELGASHVAYVVGVPSAEYDEQHVHIRNIRTGHDVSVFRVASGGASATTVTKPSWLEDSSGFVWARMNTSEGGDRLVRYTLRGSRLSYAPGSSRWATGGWAGGSLGFVASTALDIVNNEGCSDAGVSYCRVEATGPVAWGVAP